VNGKGQAFIVGLGSGPPGVWISCNRYLYAGGVALHLDDDWGPAISVSGIPPSSEWSSDLKPITLTVKANDNGTGADDDGLGIDYITINPEGAAKQEDNPGCSGLYGSVCPTVRTWQKTFTGDSMRQGIRDLGVTAADPTGKTVEQHYTTRVDNDLPEVSLSGQLAQATGEVVSYGEGENPVGQGEDKLSLPVYKLEIKAKDGSKASSLTKRSGVKSIKVFLDKKETTIPWAQNSSCPETSCEMSVTYTLPVSTINTGGKHELEVKAEDFVGHVQPRTIEFEYFPATGMKDEYVMHYFPLPNGQGDEEEELHPVRPELAVNVMNGNLVYRERDIDISGTAGVDLEVERFYNSMLPNAENTEWGDGWTLAETPDLEPVDTGGTPAPDEAELVDQSGALDDEVRLPTETGAESFDPALQATVEKKSTGGYEMSDATGEEVTSVVFDETGQAEARLTEGAAKVDYSYEGGDLAEIEVSDPSTFAADPKDLAIPEPELITAPTFDSSFGTIGAGDGQLKSPSDVAVDPQGNLWVVDKGNNRVEKFDAGGKYLTKFGSLGAGDGQFNRPTAIAIVGNGNLLVTDAGNGRVQRFSASGAFISKFGSKGTGNGQFGGSGPEGIAVDASGNIWVSDTYGGRLEKFNSSGEFLKAVGIKGSGSGQLGEPTGLDVDSSGNVWVADWQNNRISRFNGNGEFLSQFGSLGSGDGQFSHPDEIEIDKLGGVWIGDQGNNRIQQFDLSAQFKGKFGSSGTGQGQFSLTYPLGIVTDSKGHLWVTDVNNHRVQKWQVPLEKPAYISSFGINGSGDGQLKSPGDVVLGAGGLWVVDKGNNRIQKFDTSGKYLAKFGSLGAGDGQFNRPTSIAVDRDGNLLVVDSSNNRIQKFDPSGQFISKFGSAGAGNGQFAAPEGVVADFEGNVWVSDTDNGRLQKFDENGNFLEVVGAKGSGTGQLGEPTGLDVDPEGNVWVADWLNNRISIFSSDGDFLGSFGSAGSGPGQFNHPEEVEIDGRGNVWVADQGNYRVQRFDLQGNYVGQTGIGTFFFSGPAGIAADRLGHLWVTDSGESRIQRWQLGNYMTDAPELDLSDGDPKVTVETPAGLVSEVAGNAAGTHTYTHVGDDLTATTSPEGESTYEYDASGRMTKVTLTNGTWAEIGYESTYGRVKEVTVSVEGGTPKTTRFTYKDTSPRRTTVEVPGAPNLTYDIGDDGSVLKWWNTQKPPTLNLGGSLYDMREKPGELSAGSHLLEATAESAEGIASIKVLEDGNTLVSEKTCEQVYDNAVTECVKDTDEWVTETELHAPGHLDLEVIAIDTDGESSSERFWVDIPQPPPPPAPGTPIPPKFNEILQFREEYGLEKVFPVASETELNERIFNLIKAWYEPGTPAGQVARASWERWGIPMRPEDVAEMEYRELYVEHDGPMIDEWGYSHYANEYAGYSVVHRDGGIIQVNFTANQAMHLSEMTGDLALLANDRIGTSSVPPTRPRIVLENLDQAIADFAASDSQLRNVVTEVGVDEEANVVIVEATDTVLAKSRLAEAFPDNPGYTVIYQDEKPVFEAGRNRTTGRMLAGDRILTEWADGVKTSCTAAFGAYEDRDRLSDGRDIRARFLLSAGHCAPINQEIYRSDKNRPAFEEEKKDWRGLGHVTRSPFNVPPLYVDSLAVRLESDGIAPHFIFGRDGNRPRIEPPVVAHRGERLCVSGAATGGVRCGNVTGIKRAYYDDLHRKIGVLKVNFETHPGDSGAPVWKARTGASVGILSGGYRHHNIKFVLPLLDTPTGRATTIAGGIEAPEMYDMHIITDE
jgi:YD repeat-containing protein